MSNKITKLTLDYSKWRSGEDGPNKIGQGTTSLLNKEGFQCCLGMWCEQQGVDKSWLLDNGEPGEIEEPIPLFNASPYYGNTTLSDDCIAINDRISTTPEEKIQQLSERLAKEDIELEVINKP